MVRFSLIAGVCLAAVVPLTSATANSSPKSKVKETVLYAFCQGGQDAHCPDGSYPNATLSIDKSGNLYGVTTKGGVTVHDSFGDSYNEGVVFKVTAKGAYSVLHAFNRDEYDPYNPEGCAPGTNSVALDSAGNVYGLASECGYNSDTGDHGGNAFSLTPAGGEAYLWQFSGLDDGAGASGGLFRDGAGSLYGTASSGGTANQHRCGAGNNSACGVVFKLVGNALQTLHVFNGGQYGDGDGFGPYWGVIADKKGNLYGTTNFGGSGQGGGDGCGVVFELTAAGKEKILHSFACGADSGPLSGLTLGPDGNLYGAAAGGANGAGRIYMVTTKGKFSTVHDFGGAGDGNAPNGVVFDQAGNMFGTTANGGAGSCGGGCGSVFEIAADGSESVVYSFPGGNAGQSPSSNLVVDKKGNLFGVTFYGGANGAGTVFEIKMKGAK